MSDKSLDGWLAAGRSYRHAAKPIRFHRSWCRHPYTATCTCGVEPFYSPAARMARGEIYPDGSFVRRTDNRDPGDEDGSS